MWKFIIIALASLCLCGFAVSYCPALQNHAFFLGQNSIRWSMLLFVGCVVGCYKVVGK